MNKNIYYRFAFLFLILFISNIFAQGDLVWQEKLSGTNALAIGMNPLDNTVIYTQKDGRFQVSQDAGDTWQARGILPGFEDRNIVVFPQDTSIILMYTANNILKTRDGGWNWFPVLSNVSMDGETIEFHPQSPDTVYFADFTFGTLFMSADTGTTWNAVTSMGVTSVCAMTVNPENPKIIVAGGGNTRIVRSTDGGLNWSEVKTGNPYFSEIPKLVWDRQNPNIIYGTGYLDERFSVFKSTDYGATWFTPGMFGVPMWGIDIDPVSGEIYMGAFDQFERFNQGVHKSYDGGNSWQRVGNIINNATWMIKIADNQSVYALSLQGAFGVGSVYRLDPAPLGKVAGVISDSSSGVPVEAAIITVEGTTDTIWVGNPGGEYTVAMVPGTYTLIAKVGAIEKRFPDVTFTANSTTPLDMDLPLNIEYVSLSGSVLNTNNEPVPTELILYGELNEVIPQSFTVRTDENGNFAFDSLSSLLRYDSLEVRARQPYVKQFIKSIELPLVMDIEVDVADILLVNNANIWFLIPRWELVTVLAGLTISSWNVNEEGGEIPAYVSSETKKNSVFVHGFPLSPGIADTLSAMADAGSNIFISGSNIPISNSATDLFMNKLGIGSSGFNTAGSYMRGIPGTPLGEGIDSAFVFPGIPQNALTINDPKAQASFHYGNDTTAIAAVTVDNTGNGGKAVVFGHDILGMPDFGVIIGLISRSVAYFDQAVGIEDNPIALIPQKTELFDNYPNPFNPTTTIKYALQNASEITIKIYNMLGQEVRTLVNQNQQAAGTYQVQWDATNNRGSKVASGLYIYRMDAGSVVKTRKMLLLK